MGHHKITTHPRRNATAQAVHQTIKFKNAIAPLKKIHNLPNMSAQLPHNITLKKVSFSETVYIFQALRQISLSPNQIPI